MLAALTLLLLKNRYELTTKINGVKPAAITIVYIPDCCALKNEGELLQVMRQNVLINFPKYDKPLHSTADIYSALVGNPMILIADQWNALDEDASARASLTVCVGSPRIKMLGMSMTSSVWCETRTKTSQRITKIYYGSFTDAEFRVWLGHEANPLFNDNRDELAHLTGRTPILLSAFTQAYQECDTGDDWATLVQKVWRVEAVTGLKGAMEAFYEGVDKNTIWKIYTSLTSDNSASLKASEVDHRVFFNDGSQWTSIGGIATQLLYLVWERKANKDRILQ